MDWLEGLFGVRKPIIGMCHLKAVPGDPDYDPERGIGWVVDQARQDMQGLQEGGVDGVMFSNEASLPYMVDTEPITSITMARIIGELRNEICIPFGVNVLWDARATVELAVATGAQFAREIFTGVYASDFGLWNTDAGEVVRHQRRLHGGEVRLLYNIVPESAAYLGQRDIAEIARSTVFNSQPDALCVSGLTAGTETSSDTLRRVKDAVPDTAVFANTGVRRENVARQLSIADGAVVGTTFKEGGYIWNPVDVSRVSAFMDEVERVRSRAG